MARGVRNLLARVNRGELILVLQSYSRSAALLESSRPGRTVAGRRAVR